MREESNVAEIRLGSNTQVRTHTISMRASPCFYDRSGASSEGSFLHDKDPRESSPWQAGFLRFVKMLHIAGSPV